MADLSLVGFKAFEQLPMQVVDLSRIHRGNAASMSDQGLIRFLGERYILLSDALMSGWGALLDARSLQVNSIWTSARYVNEIFEVDGLLFAPNGSTVYIFPVDKPVRTIMGQVKHNYGTRPLTPTGTDASTYHSVATSTLGIGNPSAGGTHFWDVYRDSRYRVAPATVNDTYPTLADPVAGPALAAVGSGGHLAAGTAEVAIAWMTRTNTRRARYGMTLPSPTVTQATGANDTLTVTIPAFPANAIGCMVFARMQGGSFALSGVARAEGAFSLKAVYDQLGMNDAIFFKAQNAGFWKSSSIANIATALTFSNMNNANDVGAYGTIFSPFLPAFHNFWTKSGASGIDQWAATNLVTNAFTTAAVKTPTGDAPFAQSGIGSNATYGYARIPIPELGAMAVLDMGQGITDSMNVARIHSLVTGELLDSVVFPSLMAFGQQNSYRNMDFQTIDGITYAVAWWPKGKQLYRQPVRINP